MDTVITGVATRRRPNADAPGASPPDGSRRAGHGHGKAGAAGIAAGALAVATGLLAATVPAVRSARRRQVAGEVAAPFGQATGVAPGVLAEADLAGLPEPVRRWLRAAGVVGKVRPATVRLRQEGEFRTGEDRRWMPFRAEQYFTTDPPGFVWSVRMRVAPFVSITGRDRYAGGEGSIRMRLLSVIPVAGARGAG
jgi:hypothetical protein